MLLCAVASPRLAHGLIPATALLLGMTNITRREETVSPRDLRLLVGDRAQLATVRCLLTETPSYRILQKGNEPAYRISARAEVLELTRAGRTEPAFGQIAISTPGLPDPGWFEGQTVELTGVIGPPPGPAAPGLLDYRNYLKNLGIHHAMKVESTNEWRVLDPSGPNLRPPLKERFTAWAQANLAKGLGPEDEELRLLWGMILGWKPALTGEVSEPFMRTGTLHIFAISGLHVALIAGILVSLLRLVRVARGACGAVAIPLIWFYTAATGWQPSAIRSTIMSSVIIFGWAIHRPSHLLSSVAASGLIILLWQPEQLFQASFQLSFFVVLALAMFAPMSDAVRGLMLNTAQLAHPDPMLERQQLLANTAGGGTAPAPGPMPHNQPAPPPPLSKQLAKAVLQWLMTDPLLPPELRTPFQKARDKAVLALFGSLSTSLVAWMGSLPIVAYYFYLVTPVTLLANMIIVPLSSLALMSGMGSLITGDLLPPCTELFNNASWGFMKAMIWVAEALARPRWAYFYVKPPGPVFFTVYYAVLLGLATRWLPSRLGNPWLRAAGVALALFAAGSWWREVRATRLTVLPGSGSPILVNFPGRGRDLLVDCSDERAAQRILKPFLHSQGYRDAPPLLLTHGDKSHVGGFSFMEAEFSPPRVLTSPLPSRSKAYRDILAALEERPDRWRKIGAGDEVNGWTVLHPPKEARFARADDKAVVLAAAPEGIRTLLLSDLGRLGQRALLENHEDLRADIVIVGLPQQDEVLPPALLERIAPRLVILDGPSHPAQNKAFRGARTRLRQARIATLCTAECGAVTLAYRDRACVAQAMNGETFQIAAVTTTAPGR